MAKVDRRMVIISSNTIVEAARRLGVSRQRVAALLPRLGLAHHFQERRRARHRVWRRLFKMGWTDARIARETAASTRTVRGFRTKEGIPANAKRGRPKGRRKRP